MDYNSGAYKLVLLLHLLTVVAGFGPTLLAPAFAAQARSRRGKDGVAVFDATYTVLSTYATWIVYAVPVFGILLVMLADPPWSFSQAWISLSFLLYIISLGVAHALHQPNLRKMGELMAQVAEGPPPGAAAGGPPPQVAEIESRGQRAGLFGAVLNVLFLLILILMIWKPGAPPGA
jgi:uncharacterized membrane protein